MKFEKQFPSLKEDTIVPFQNGKLFVDIEAIQENCLDKAKVRETIDNWNNKEFKGSLKSEIKLLKKELGL